ncbi:MULTISPECIES: anti-sigma factor family protein [unclassified Blastococcus]
MSAVTGPPHPRTPDDDRVLEIACQEFVELVTEHLEGTLPDALERAVAAHLDLCDPCVVYLEQVRGTTAALRGLPSATLPPAARERLLDVFDAVHGRATD